MCCLPYSSSLWAGISEYFGEQDRLPTHQKKLIYVSRDSRLTPPTSSTKLPKGIKKASEQNSTTQTPRKTGSKDNLFIVFLKENLGYREGISVATSMKKTFSGGNWTQFHFPPSSSSPETHSRKCQARHTKIANFSTSLQRSSVTSDRNGTIKEKKKKGKKNIKLSHPIPLSSIDINVFPLKTELIVRVCIIRVLDVMFNCFLQVLAASQSEREPSLLSATAIGIKLPSKLTNNFWKKNALFNSVQTHLRVLQTKKSSFREWVM